MNIYLLIDLLAILSLLGLGTAVLMQSRTTQLNRIFAIFVSSVSIWIISNYISNDIHNPPHVAVIANYFVFAFSFLSSALMLWFTAILAEDKKAIRLLRKTDPFIALVFLLCFTPLVVRNVELQGPLYAVVFGPLVSVYGLGLLLYIVGAWYVAFRNIKRTKGAQRVRIQILARSLVVAVPLLLVTQFVLPTVTGWFGLTNLGLLTIFIVVAAFYYEVAKHKLFDLRLFIVRSMGYAVSVGIILVTYALISNQITTHATRFIANENIHNLINASLVIVGAITFAPLKSYFNKITNKIFYRDAYDPQELLDGVNGLVLSTVDLDKLTTAVARVVNYHLKAAFVMFCLRHTAYAPQRFRGDGASIDVPEDDIEQISQLASHIPEAVIVAENLDESSKLRRLLIKNNVAAVARLVTTLNYEIEGQGIILFGYKKSGNPYSKQDENILGIITGEVVIAIENALRFEEIENFNVTLQDKVDDATRRLKRANDKLKAMDETKDEFISMASHQLRTPLTSVKGYVSMVLEGDAGPLNETQHKLLEQSFASSQRMVFLIADLLNLSRLRTGKFVIENKPTNLADVIESEIEQLKASAASRNLTLTYDKPKDFPLLMLDETKMRQVIMNFSDNAIYYTPSGGKIDIKLRETRDSVEFTVNDNGIGIPAGEQHHLFNKFYRAKNAQKARPDGTGLGLFMAKKVIIAQGGAIVFRSIESKGSTFGFTFSKQKLKVPETLPSPEVKEPAAAKA